MLVLTLDVGETLYIGEDIEVMVVARSGSRVKLGTTALKDVPIDREAVRQAKLAERRRKNSEGKHGPK